MKKFTAIIILMLLTSVCMGEYLKQSTAVDVVVGPLIDAMDGKTPIVTLTQADITAAIFRSSVRSLKTLTSSNFSEPNDGYWILSLDANDTNTLGPVKITLRDDDVFLPVRQDYMVISKNQYESLFDPTTLYFYGGYATKSSGIPSFAFTNFSVELWIKPDNRTGDRTLINKYQGIYLSNRHGWYVKLNTSNQLVFYMEEMDSGGEDGDGSEVTLTTSALPYETWTHVVLTVNRSGVITPYINGVAGTTVNCSAVNGNIGDVAIYFGATPNIIGSPSANYYGFMRTVALYNSVLTAGQVTARFNAGNYLALTGTESGLIFGANLYNKTGIYIDDLSSGNLDVSFSGINGIWYTSSLEPPVTSADVSKAATNAIASSGVSTFDPDNDSVYIASYGLDNVSLYSADDPENPTTLMELIYQTWLDVSDVNTAINQKIDDVNGVIVGKITANAPDNTAVITKIQDVNSVINTKLDLIPKKTSKPTMNN